MGWTDYQSQSLLAVEVWVLLSATPQSSSLVGCHLGFVIGKASRSPELNLAIALALGFHPRSNLPLDRVKHLADAESSMARIPLPGCLLYLLLAIAPSQNRHFEFEAHLAFVEGKEIAVFHGFEWMRVKKGTKRLQNQNFGLLEWGDRALLGFAGLLPLGKSVGKSAERYLGVGVDIWYQKNDLEDGLDPLAAPGKVLVAGSSYWCWGSLNLVQWAGVG